MAVSRLRTAFPVNWQWVDAGPFRAHLQWLAEATGASGVTIAQLTGVPPRLVNRLLEPHQRPLRRLPPQFARQLLLLTPRTITECRANSVPAIRVRRILLALAARGDGDAALALLTGLEPARVTRLRLGLIGWLDEYTEATVLGRCSAAGFDLERIDDVLSAVAA